MSGSSKRPRKATSKSTAHKKSKKPAAPRKRSRASSTMTRTGGGKHEPGLSAVLCITKDGKPVLSRSDASKGPDNVGK
jgi:hypothetical protein